jgi:hypothetical protein
MTGHKLVFIPGRGHENGQKAYWTTEYVVDRLYLEMVEKEDDAQGWEDYQHKGQKEKYYDRAKKAIYTFTNKHCPVFIINISDLSLRLKEDLNSLGDPTLDYVIRESIGRVCRDVISSFDVNLKHCLEWRFEK